MRPCMNEKFIFLTGDLEAVDFEDVTLATILLRRPQTDYLI